MLLVASIMTYIGRFHIYCWIFLVFIENVHSNPSRAQLLSLCNQSLNLKTSSSLSLIHTPSPYPSCCNITVVRSLPDLSEQIIINILNTSTFNTSLKIYNKSFEVIKLAASSSSNPTYFKSDIVSLPITLSLCSCDVPAFEIFLTNIYRGPCKATQYRCLIAGQDQWCIDDSYPCNSYQPCPPGTDEYSCTKSASKPMFSKIPRTIRGGIVTTIIVLGLLLIVGSVIIALAFIYFRRKNQRQRQFTYSLESTSDDWEPSGTGYHLFNNWTTNRRHTGNNIDNVIIDANEHMPIATNMTNR